MAAFNRKDRKNTQKNRRGNRRVRRIEQLEARQLMAVDMTQSTFDPTVFEENMEAIFAPNVVGFGFALNYDGEVAAAAGGGGQARTAADPAALGFDETTEMEVASVSKPITAVALIHLIQSQIKEGTFTSSDETIQQVLDDEDATMVEKVGAALNTKLADYVPKGWTAGTNVHRVTLRHLLTHNSGFVEGDSGDDDPNNDDNGTTHNFNSFNQNTWSNIRDLYERHLESPTETYSDTGDERWTRSYNNANFTYLAKVVIPRLRGAGIAVDDGDEVVTDLDVSLTSAELDAYSGNRYMWYLQDDVFAPMGLTDVSLETDGTAGDDVRAYSINDPAGTNGSTMSSYIATGGAFGWKLSAEELATFLESVRHDDSLLDPEVRQMMFDRGLGWTTGNDPGYGANYGHGGLQRMGNQSFRSQIGVFDFGNGDSIEVAVLMNSESNTLPFGAENGAGVFVGSIPESTKEAFHQAWTHIVYDGTEGADTFTFAVDSSGFEPVLEVYQNSNLVLSQWLSTLQSLTINGLGGDDEFIIDELPDSVELTLNGGDDDDTWRAAEISGDLQLVNRVTFNGDAGTDLAILNDANNVSTVVGGNDYFVSAKQVHRTGGSPGNLVDVDAYMTGVENLTLTTSSMGDWVEVLSTASSLTLNTSDGNDIIVGSSVLENISSIDGLVVNGGEGLDRLTIYDEQNAYPHADSDEYRIANTAVERRDNGNALRVEMNSVEALELTTGARDDLVEIDSIPLDTTLHLGEGNDVVNIHSTADRTNLEIFGNEGTDVFNVAPSGQDLDLVQGDVTIHGGYGFGSFEHEGEYVSPTDDDQVYVYDDLNANPDSGDFTVEVADPDTAISIGRITRASAKTTDKNGLKTNDFVLTYDQIERTSLSADDDANNIDVVGVPLYNQLSVYAGGGDDEIDVHSTPASAEMFVFGEGGADVVRVAPIARNLDALGSTLNVDGGSDVGDQLQVNDYEFLGQKAYLLSGLSFWRANDAETAQRRVRYAGLEQMELRLNDQDNTVDVQSTAAGTAVAVHGYQGNDMLTVSSASSAIEFFGGNEAVGTDNDQAVWIGTEADDAFVLAGNSISHGDGSLTTHDDVERRRIVGGSGLDLLRLEGVAGEDELLHVVPQGLTPYQGQIAVGSWLPVDYSLEEIAVVGNVGDVDRLRLDGPGLEENYFDVNLVAQGTHASPVAILSVAEGELLRVRSATGLSSGGTLATPAFEIHAAGQANEFDIVARDGNPGENPTSVSVYNEGAWATLNVEYSTAAMVDHQPSEEATPGQVSVVYQDLALEVTYYNFDEATLQETLPGDLDGNGVVDDGDYQLLKDNFGETVAPYTNGDANGDGEVDIDDFTVWKDHKGAALDPADGGAAAAIQFAAPATVSSPEIGGEAAAPLDAALSTWDVAAGEPFSSDPTIASHSKLRHHREPRVVRSTQTSTTQQDASHGKKEEKSNRRDAATLDQLFADLGAPAVRCVATRLRLAP